MYWLKQLFSHREAHWNAFCEVACVCIFSLAPLAVSLFVQNSQAQDGIIKIEPTWYLLFGKGQMYLMGYGLFGTIFWLAFWSGDKEPHKARRFLGSLAILGILPIFAGFGVDPTFSSVNNPTIITFSYCFYGLFAAIYYLLVFYVAIEPPTPTSVFSDGVKDLVAGYEGLKK